MIDLLRAELDKVRNMKFDADRYINFDAYIAVKHNREYAVSNIIKEIESAPYPGLSLKEKLELVKQYEMVYNANIGYTDIGPYEGYL